MGSPYFNQRVMTPNGPGTGDMLIYSHGERRQVVRHVITEMTGRAAGYALTRIRPESVTCLFHYEFSEISRLGNN